jgi:hypothetical protein
MKQHSISVWLCLLAMVLLLTACGKRAMEETFPTDITTQPATGATQPTTQTDQGLENGELPQVTLPQQTEPSTQPQENEKPGGGNTGTANPPETSKPTEDTTPPEASKPAEGTIPPVATEPSEETGASESTQPPTVPPETSQPTNPTEPPFDEDELPPIPVG